MLEASCRSSRELARKFPTCSAIKDIISWEGEYIHVQKKPNVGGSVVGGGDLFGQFGNMMKGIVKQSDTLTERASLESESVKVPA